MIQNGHDSEFVYNQPLWFILQIFKHSSVVALEKVIVNKQLDINVNIASQSEKAYKEISKEFQKMLENNQ